MHLIQVQCQLVCTKSSYCDFIIWTQKDLHIERIYPDTSFIDSNTKKSKLIFERAIMPEIVGRFFSQPSMISPQSSSQSLISNNTEQNDQVYCYCQTIEDGEMIGCDNPNYCYKWFHLKCVHLDRAPKSKLWYCPDCRKQPEFKRNTCIKKRRLF